MRALYTRARMMGRTAWVIAHHKQEELEETKSQEPEGRSPETELGSQERPSKVASPDYS